MNSNSISSMGLSHCVSILKLHVCSNIKTTEPEVPKITITLAKIASYVSYSPSIVVSSGFN